MKLSHLLTLVLLVIAFGCRKADYLSLPQYAYAEKALQLPPNASPTLQRIAKELKRQNNLPGYRGYLNDFFQKEGVPRWDKAQIQISAPRGTAYRSAGQPDTVVVIPLVLENEAAVNGFLQATLSVAAVNIWHYNVGEYDRFPFGDEQNYSAEDFVGLVIKMNYEVFGYKKFQILDNRLFPETSDTSVSGLMKRTFTIKEDSISPHLSVKIPGTFCYMVPSGGCNCATKPYCIDWFNCPSRVCGKEVCIEYVVHVDLDGPYEEDESIFPAGNQNGQNHGGGQGGGAGGSGPTETGGNPLPDCAEAGAQLPSGYYQPCKRGTFIPVIDIEEDEEVLNDEEIAPENDLNYNIDENNNTVGGYDTTSYPEFNFYTEPWPTIEDVIPKADFVKLPNPYANCLEIAKQQIGKKNYQISDYLSPNQTFQIYRTGVGANIPVTKQAVSYLIYALQNGIPVIAGVDNRDGSPNPHTDNTTDHFIVITGMGKDNKGSFFKFFDNSTSLVSTGTHLSNKLYYNEPAGLIIGKSMTSYAANDPDKHDYIVTQIRKSKPL